MTTLIESLRRTSTPTELSFPAAEYSARQERARAAMASRGIDLLLFTHLPSICYLTGYQTPATSDYNGFFLAAHGGAALQVIEHEVPNAYLTACVDDVRAFSWYIPGSIPTQAAEIVADLCVGGERITIGVESSRAALTPGLLDLLRHVIPRAKFLDATDLLDGQRVIKSAAEVAYLRESGCRSVLAADAALDAAHVGCTDNDIAAAAYEAMIRSGSEYASTQPFIATGERSGMVHTTFKRRSLAAGDAIFVETASSFHRYTAPVMRSGVLGTPSDTILRLREGVATTLAILLDEIAPGRSAHEVARAASRGFSALRDEIFFQGAFGYHVGLSLPPAWWEGLSPYIAEGVDGELRPGMVFHLPIAARIPAVCGVALSETVLVTETGCEPLTARERTFRDIPV